ncbi:MAG: hypothetical protein RPU90_12155 [Candidatus Sedimenticola sp. (ex Thyasira tokunagai)]
MNKRKPKSVNALEELGLNRLSRSFCMRDFLYSEVSDFYGVPNIPDDPDLAIASGRKLCTELLEPLIAVFGPVTIVSGYRSPEVNDLCNKKRLNCASNEKNYAGHIWDRKDSEGNMGATASIIVHTLTDQDGGWQSLAWWIHDHLPYHSLQFFKGGGFNIQWRENPEGKIYSYIEPKGYLTRAGMENFEGDHSNHYNGSPDYP